LSGCCLSLLNLSCERDERLLFEDVSHDFNPGTITQIAGHNGVGKTTLMKMIVGIIAPLSGSITWQNSDGKTANILESLLYLGHAPAVKASLTPLENIRWYFGINGCKGSHTDKLSDDAFKSALDHVGLTGYEDIPCYQMSAGQQRRVALARLYLSSAPLWILDEPLTAIDVHGAIALQRKMATHALRGGIVIVTTHQPLAIENINIFNLSDFVPSFSEAVYD